MDSRYANTLCLAHKNDTFPLRMKILIYALLFPSSCLSVSQSASHSACLAVCLAPCPSVWMRYEPIPGVSRDELINSARESVFLLHSLDMQSATNRSGAAEVAVASTFIPAESDMWRLVRCWLALGKWMNEWMHQKPLNVNCSFQLVSVSATIN